METDELAASIAGAESPAAPQQAGKPSWSRRLREWCSRQWAAIRPGPEARRGAVWGTLVAAAACVIIGGLYLESGFGYVFDFAFCILFAAICIPLVALLVMLLLAIARKLHRLPPE